MHTLATWARGSSSLPVIFGSDEAFTSPSESLHKFLQGLRIDPRRLMSKLLHVLNVRPRIDSGIAVGAALTA